MYANTFHQIDLPKLGSAAAGATEIARASCNALPVKLRVTKLLFTPDTAITASAAVYATIVVKIGATTIATITTNTTANGGTGDMAAATCYDLSAFISATGADLQIDSLEAVGAAKTAYESTGTVISGVFSLQTVEQRS